MTEQEFVDGLHNILPSHNDETTKKWLDALCDRAEQFQYALYAFSFVSSNFNEHILNAVYHMQPVPNAIRHALRVVQSMVPWPWWKNDLSD